MNIKQAKQEIINTVQAYLTKDETGEYAIPVERQRPVLLIGPPGIGKTAIMEQVAQECGINLVSYTITHHTRQSAIGLPFISKKTYDGEDVSVTEYTMSEIIASIYDQIEQSGIHEGILFLDESTVYPRRWLRRCCSSCSTRHLEITGYRMALSSLRREILRNTTSRCGILILLLMTVSSGFI